MKLIITANTFEEEVRNAIIHMIDKELSIIDLLIISGAIATSIQRGETLAAAVTLWVYSEKEYRMENAQEIIEQLEQTIKEAY